MSLDVASRLELPDLTATRALASRLAALLSPGDVVLLEGELGAGKSELARAVIRARADAAIEVPSPTFTRVQVYELPGLTIAHADLYRLRSPSELRELGLDELAMAGVLMVEWPERAIGLWGDDTLRLHLEGPIRGASAEARRLVVTAGPSWHERLQRLLAP